MLFIYEFISPIYYDTDDLIRKILANWILISVKLNGQELYGTILKIITKGKLLNEN